MTGEPTAAEAGAGRGRAVRALGLAALAVAGVALAVLPHAANWWRVGDPNYVAEGDQLLYMAWSREAVLRGRPDLADAVHRRSGPMMHPWLLFVPPALLARASGSDLRALPVVWRALAGVGLSLGLYAAARPAVRDRRVAAGVAALLLFDAGLLFGQPLVRQAAVVRDAFRPAGSFFAGVPTVMAHFRVVPPALALPFLLAHYGLALRARVTGSRAAAAGAGATFGLLFYVYFYFWSAVTVGAAAAFVLDPKGRRLHAAVLALGLAVGLPAVAANARAKAATPPDWLQRTDKFVRIGHFEDLLVPKIPLTLWLASAPWVFRGRRELTYWWCCAGSGLFCLNQQVVTGLQVENFHWIMQAGPTLSLLLAALAAPRLFEAGRPDGRPRLALLAALVAAQVAVGFGLRWQEATRTAQTWRWERVYQSFQADGTDVPVGAVLAGDQDGVMLLAAYREVYPLAGKFVEYCSGIKDDELDARLVLNLFLKGLDREQARREVERPPGTLSWEASAVRSAAVARAQRERRIGLIEAVWSDPAGWAARFGVTHVLLPADAPPPGAALAAVGPARAVSRGRHWQLWRVEPASRLQAPSARVQ